MSRNKQIEVELEARVLGDGCVELSWSGDGAEHFHLMLVRSGAVPAYRALQLARAVRRYEVKGLSRHQRYRVAVLASRGGVSGCSRWLSVTPRAGLQPRVEQELQGVAGQLARITRLTVMPQDRRLTAYWSLTRGLVDAVTVELLRDERVIARRDVEPEVSSLSIDGSGGARLCNGELHALRVRPRFATIVGEGPPNVRCVPAAQGAERAANRALPQAGLVYPFFELGPEVRIFDEDEATAASSMTRVRCYHCGGDVSWRGYRLCCGGCGAEFVPNGRGAYLDSRRLRFGTCRCCLPHKILIQRAGSAELVCAATGKQHFRLPGEDRVRLIEELPLGLCQCCRPRRPLLRRGAEVRCSGSDELHRSDGGAWVLAPSDAVFDAAAIDELLDAGLAEICATGVSRAAR